MSTKTERLNQLAADIRESVAELHALGVSKDFTSKFSGFAGQAETIAYELGEDVPAQQPDDAPLPVGKIATNSTEATQVNVPVADAQTQVDAEKNKQAVQDASKTAPVKPADQSKS